MAQTIPQTCRIFLASILAVLNITKLKKKPPMSKQPKKSAAPVVKENNRAMEVDTVIIRNMVVMDTALMVDTDILMEAMVMEVCVNTEEVTENMEDTEITDTNRTMVEVMAMDIPLTEAMVMEEDTNRMAKDTEVDTEVTVATNSEAMVSSSSISSSSSSSSISSSSSSSSSRCGG